MIANPSNLRNLMIADRGGAAEVSDCNVQALQRPPSAAAKSGGVPADGGETRWVLWRLLTLEIVPCHLI